MNPLLLARIAKVPGPLGDECWVFTGGRNNSGYGQIWYASECHGAHRVSWALHRGPIPEGMWVLHKCDVRDCCNPAHLWLGTPQDNVQDAIAKGRDRFSRRRKRPAWRRL
jgi:HNH endonuclease